MTDLETITETKWDVSTCQCAECYRDYSHVKWFVGAGMVWVTVACLWLWY